MARPAQLNLAGDASGVDLSADLFKNNRIMKWRTILNCVAMVALSRCLCFCAMAQPAPSRPNFIFLITDDQRWDELGCVQKELGEKARFPWFKTPNMDRLADEGVRFQNAFVTDSLCSPSRATFLTGQ